MSQSRKPVISVVMPVHNALPYLHESINSIVGQTLNDFEFVILDDASSDGSSEALQAWAQKDQRIKIYRSDKRLGLSASSNAVVRRSTLPIVARMDEDEVAPPDRR